MPQSSDPTAAGRAALIRMSAATPLVVAAQSFIFVRHGETDGNAQRIYQSAEQPLNARGLAQAEAAQRALVSLPVTCIRASTMPRAWRTAEIVAAPHGLTPEPSDLLRERWFGDLVGTSSANIDWAVDPPNGERLADFVERTRRGLVAALDRDDGNVVVAHGGNLHVLVHGLGADLPLALLGNATPIRFQRRSGGGWEATAIGPVHAPSGSAADGGIS